MMGTKERNFRPLPEDISLEDLVPEDNFYRRLQEKLDLSFVRELVEDRYAASGRPSVDPEVFFRLQLVMFYEGIRSERELMRIVADRLSLRWYVGYDLFEPLPDHSSLTRIRDRFGLPVFREFFERIVQLCVEAGLVWGGELYFDATKVDANASLDSIAPRFYVEEHLGEVFTVEELPNAEQEDHAGTAFERGESPVAELYELPSAGDDALAEENTSKDDWISRNGRQRREVKGVVPAQGGLPGLEDRPRLLADEAQGEQGLAPRILRPLRRGRRQGEDHPERPRDTLRGHREPADARPALAHQLPLADPPKASHRGHRLRHHAEHRRRGARRHPCLRAANRSGQSPTLLQ